MLTLNFRTMVILTGTEFLTMNTRPKIPANARNLNACVIGSSGSGQDKVLADSAAPSSPFLVCCGRPEGGTLDSAGGFLQRENTGCGCSTVSTFQNHALQSAGLYQDRKRCLKFVTALIANTKGDGKEGDEFWTKAETLLYCALVAYIVFEGPEEERNMNTLVEMINSMEVRGG